MNYDYILSKIEQDRQNESAIDVFRYHCLIQAIEYFANRLSYDQILTSAFEFINELLTVKKSAIFIQHEQAYQLDQIRGMNASMATVHQDEKLRNFAVFCGSVCDRERLKEYFCEELLDQYEVQFMIPLIMDTTLAGFVFISEKMTGSFDSDDILISETLMRLFMSALENSRRLEKLQQANKELDEKIFNLFAINQSSRILLAEHDMEVLHGLALDVFSELTLSCRTGFFLYDEGSEKYVLKAYKDIFHSKVNKDMVTLSQNTSAAVEPTRFLINTQDASDVGYFHYLFPEGIQILEPIQPLYIVLLIHKEQILGFVTLGETVSGVPYKSSVFELVESLASYTYIALSNAILLRKLEEHKRLLQEKLNRLSSLNHLMKNINSAEDLETLQQLIIQTLEVSFGVAKGALALYQPEERTLHIASSAGMLLQRKNIILNDNWNKLEKGGIILETDEEETKRYFGSRMDKDIGQKAGFLAVPIMIERYERILLGAILVFQFRKGFLSDEENLVVTETIANLSAPILKNFMEIEKERKLLETNHKEGFCRELKRQITECLQHDIPLEVIHIQTKAGLFDEDDLSEKLLGRLDNVYPIAHNHIMVLVFSDSQYYRYTVQEILGETKAMTSIYRMGTDFTGYADFIELFQL